MCTHMYSLTFICIFLHLSRRNTHIHTINRHSFPPHTHTCTTQDQTCRQKKGTHSRQTHTNSTAYPHVNIHTAETKREEQGENCRPNSCRDTKTNRAHIPQSNIKVISLLIQEHTKRARIHHAYFKIRVYSSRRKHTVTKRARIHYGQRERRIPFNRYSQVCAT